MLIDYSADDGLLPVVGAPKEMVSVSQLEDGRTKVRINFSSLSIMQECWRKTEYSLVRKLRANLESPATLFGSAIHKGLECFYLGDSSARMIPKNYRETMLMIGAGAWEPEWSSELLYASAKAFADKAQPLSRLPAGNKRSISTGVWMLTHYFEKYLQDPFVVMSDEKGPLVERSFSMPIHSDERLFIEGFGQIDVVLRNTKTGEVLPCDHKTTTMLGPSFYSRLNPNFQYTFYSWATNAVLGLQTESFLVNALQVKEPPKTNRGSPPDFARQVTTRTADDYEELRNALIYYVEQFLINSRLNYFPMHTPGPCSNYSGCTFQDICGSPKQLRENIIKAKFSGIA